MIGGPGVDSVSLYTHKKKKGEKKEEKPQFFLLLRVRCKFISSVLFPFSMTFEVHIKRGCAGKEKGREPQFYWSLRHASAAFLTLRFSLFSPIFSVPLPECCHVGERQ